jgi:predicted GNAT superfamily acetyltransferase
MDDQIAVRSLETLAEFQACHAVQKAAWEFPDLLIIPYTQIISAQHNGGVALGAFDGAALVGFVFGYLGRQGDGPLYFYSQRMGVLPTYQGRGIGQRLKWAQRAWALEQGLDRILWTYDPLESPNAQLNIANLGGAVRQYKRDFYGQHDSPLHNYLPTDRFVVEWELQSERVLARLSCDWPAPTLNDLLAQTGQPLNSVTWDSRGLPRSTPPDLTRTEPALRVEVPAYWQTLRRADMTLAMEWRMTTRLLFEHYLAQGYAVTGYARGGAAERQRSCYLLEKG